MRLWVWYFFFGFCVLIPHLQAASCEEIFINDEGLLPPQTDEVSSSSFWAFSQLYDALKPGSYGEYPGYFAIERQRRPLETLSRMSPETNAAVERLARFSDELRTQTNLTGGDKRLMLAYLEMLNAANGVHSLKDFPEQIEAALASRNPDSIEGAIKFLNSYIYFMR